MLTSKCILLTAFSPKRTARTPRFCLFVVCNIVYIERNFWADSQVCICPFNYLCLNKFLFGSFKSFFMTNQALSKLVTHQKLDIYSWWSDQVKYFKICHIFEMQLRITPRFGFRFSFRATWPGPLLVGKMYIGNKKRKKNFLGLCIPKIW